MAFGAELQDFVSGFTTGYDLIKSKDEREWEKERRQMIRDDQTRTRERDARSDMESDRNYYRDIKRDRIGDEQWNESNRYRWDRAGRSDAEWEEQQKADERDRAIKEQNLRLKMREDTGDGVPDEVDNYEIRGAIPDNVKGSYETRGMKSGSTTREESALPTPADESVQLASLSNDGGNGGSRSWLSYTNQSATRRLPLSAELESALEKVIPGLGVRAEIFSGGQKSNRRGEGTGSVRHNDGHSGDAYFFDEKTGRRLNWANPKDRPIFEEIVRRGKEAGITGFGAGPSYMREGSMHIGFGKPGVWGKGGRGKNAPQWLKNAYYGTQAAGLARGGLVSAIPDQNYQDDEEILDDDGDGIPDEPQEVAQVLPEEGPIPSRRPQYEGVSDDTGAETDDAPTDDPYETARRAVREGMKTAIAQGRMDAQEAINDPETQKYQERYLKGYGAAPQQVVKQMMDKIDPNREMSPTQRNVLAYANTYRFFYERGEPEKAKEAATSLLQYHRQAAQQYLALGQAAAQNGDLDKAAEAAVKAYANIPNGRDMQITKTDGGYEISVTDIKTGKTANKQVVAPEEFAAAAAGFNPGTFDQEILNAAGVAPNEYSDASLEDRGTVAESVTAAVGDGMENSGLSKQGINAVRDIATDIAAVKENGVDPDQAVRFAAGLIGAGPDEVSISPERGVPGKMRVSFNGEEYVMSQNQVNKLRKVAQSIQQDRADTTRKQEENKKWWADQRDAIYKGVSAFGDAVMNGRTPLQKERLKAIREAENERDKEYQEWRKRHVQILELLRN